MNFRFVLHSFFMANPFFYSEEILIDSKQLVLNEETSKHIVQVLRMKVGEEINLADGKGNLFLAEIIDDHKKKCEVKVLSVMHSDPPLKKIAIAISLLKNASRFEWFLEKATEIGVTHVIPLLCERTEKQHFRHERMKGILISAMLQSQQSWLPILEEPMKLNEMIKRSDQPKKFIAHCLDDASKISLQELAPFNDAIMLIGPEGDFTNAEIDLALQKGFKPTTLGETRLRTETAGIVAATLLCNL